MDLTPFSRRQFSDAFIDTYISTLEFHGNISQPCNLKSIYIEQPTISHIESLRQASPNLQNLTVYVTNQPDKILNEIMKMTSLKTLFLMFKDTYENYQLLGKIKMLTKIKVLKDFFDRLTQWAFEGLGQVQFEKPIERNTNHFAYQILSLSKLSEYFRFQIRNLHEQGFIGIWRLLPMIKTLKSLKLSTWFDNTSFQFLEITFSGNNQQMFEQNITTLRDITERCLVPSHLKLTIEYKDCGNRDLEKFLLKNSKIQQVKLSFLAIQDSFIEILAKGIKHNQLQKLELNKNENLTFKSLSILGEYQPSLVDLKIIEQVNISNKGLKLIAQKFAQLKYLMVWGCRGNDKGVVYLKKLKKLECLNLNETYVSLRMFEGLLKGLKRMCYYELKRDKHLVGKEIEGKKKVRQNVEGQLGVWLRIDVN